MFFLGSGTDSVKSVFVLLRGRTDGVKLVLVFSRVHRGASRGSQGWPRDAQEPPGGQMLFEKMRKNMIVETIFRIASAISGSIKGHLGNHLSNSICDVRYETRRLWKPSFE